MDTTLTIKPDWDEVEAVYTGTVEGHPEMETFRASRREDLEQVVTNFMAAQTPRPAFRIRWPDKTAEFRPAA